MFQFHVLLADVGQSRNLFNGFSFELGEWIHVGWSYHNEVSTTYKDGCQHQKISTWVQDSSIPATIAGFLFGSESNIDMDVQLDEMYFWEVRKPASVFSALYVRGSRCANTRATTNCLQVILKSLLFLFK